jgi:hypothetical protein
LLTGSGLKDIDSAAAGIVEKNIVHVDPSTDDVREVLEGL